MERVCSLQKITNTTTDSCDEEIILVGNPNTGKTTLFNALTYSDEHIGN